MIFQKSFSTTEFSGGQSGSEKTPPAEFGGTSVLRTQRSFIPIVYSKLFSIVGTWRKISLREGISDDIALWRFRVSGAITVGRGMGHSAKTMSAWNVCLLACPWSCHL